MKKILALAMAAALALSLVACGGGETSAPADSGSASTSAGGEEKLSIGATFYSLQNEFTMRMDNAGKKWAEANGVDYVGYDGNYDAATQLSQVETMISNGVDAIILNPHDADACAACVEVAHAAGIPVIGVNTMVNSDLLTSYVGSLDVSAGEDIMNKMIEHIGNTDFNIVIIEGPMGQSAQLQRYEGISNVLANNPDIDVLAIDTANWSRSEAMTLMETWLTTYGEDIDAVIGENDEMALGARQAIVAAGLDIPCIGVDGIADAVTAVSTGDMIASDFQNAEGQMTGALDAAVTVINGGSVEKEIWIPFEMITPDNYEEYVNKY
jgi:ABC-type sugar transport system substrate-binding protein